MKINNNKMTKITKQEQRKAQVLSKFLNEEYFIALTGEETLQELEETLQDILDSSSPDDHLVLV